jgi:hypothetical protein
MATAEAWRFELKKGRSDPGDIGIGRLGDAFGNTWSAYIFL